MPDQKPNNDYKIPDNLQSKLDQIQHKPPQSSKKKDIFHNHGFLNIFMIALLGIALVCIGWIVVIIVNSNGGSILQPRGQRVSNCIEGSIIFDNGSYKVCDGYDYTEEGVDTALSAIEDAKAKRGIIDFQFPYIDNKTKLVTGNQLEANFLPNGIAMYIPTKNGDNVFMVTNHILIPNSNNIDNQFFGTRS